MEWGATFPGCVSLIFLGELRILTTTSLWSRHFFSVMSTFSFWFPVWIASLAVMSQRKVDGFHRGVFLTSALASSSARGPIPCGDVLRCRNSPAPPASAPRDASSSLPVTPSCKTPECPQTLPAIPLTKSAPVLEAQRISAQS